MPLDNDDIKQLIAILQRGLSNTDSDQEPSSPKEDDSIMNTKSVKAKKNSKNKFLSMGVKDLHKDDTAIDKILNSSPPTPRTRQFSSVDVVCRSCGKKETINPSLIHDSVDRYKCNKCSTNPG
jgi:lysyl-tRNA synthetase class I